MDLPEALDIVVALARENALSDRMGAVSENPELHAVMKRQQEALKIVERTRTIGLLTHHGGQS
jgi:hypothetical protein